MAAWCQTANASYHRVEATGADPLSESPRSGCLTSAPPLAASRLAEIPEEIRPTAEWDEVTELLARAGREADGWPR